MRMRALAMTLLLALAPLVVRAQASATVALGDPAYDDVDVLIDQGLVSGIFVGQRPYARATFARLARQAALVLERPDGGADIPAAARAATQRLLVIFHDELADSTGDSPRYHLREVRLDALLTGEPRRAVPSNGLGTQEADLASLTDNRNGRRFVRGANVALESAHTLELPFGASLSARPRVWATDERGTGARSLSGELLAASLRVVQRNVAVTVGREYTDWSTSTGDGLLFGSNAPALDMVRLASDVPFRLPAIMRGLGDVSATVQVADLGVSSSRSHSRLVSYKLSVRPTPTLELGASFDNHFGGSGAPKATALDRFIDLVPLLDVFRHHVDSTSVESDKLLATDARLAIPSLGHITVFGQAAVEDVDFHRVRSILTEDAAYTGGVIIPRLFAPTLSARVEYHRAGIRFYAHHLLTNGITSRRFILGDDLGHDADGVAGLVRFVSSNALSVAFDAATETRRNDTYVGTYTLPGAQGFVFTRLAVLPSERRVRGGILTRWNMRGGDRLVELRLSAVRMRNFGFEDRPSELHGAASAAFAWYR